MTLPLLVAWKLRAGFDVACSRAPITVTLSSGEDRPSSDGLPHITFPDTASYPFILARHGIEPETD